MTRSRRALHQDGWYAIVPLEWAERAADRCPLRALRVGLALWHLVGRLHRRQLYVTGQDLAFYMGGSVVTARRGLTDLARAELITLIRRPRHSYLVTLPDEQTLQAWLEEQARQGGEAAHPFLVTRSGPPSPSTTAVEGACSADCQCAECVEAFVLPERLARDD